MHSPTIRTAVCTALAMIAFAANSVLCRLALQGPSIDPASFTAVRLGSGAILLVLVAAVYGTKTRARDPPARGLRLASAAMLFAYALAFSFAYVALTAATGALLLFGAVQTTMLLAVLVRGQRLSSPEWIGLAVAGAGLVYLVSPGLAAPSFRGAALMMAAGVAWGAYSLLGHRVADPVRSTAANFVGAAALALVATLAFEGTARISTRGAILAATSGSVTSGLGYVLWYAALRELRSTTAAIVQLSVPAIAAAAGVVLLGERLSSRLLLASALILGGIGLAVGLRSRP